MKGRVSVRITTRMEVGIVKFSRMTLLSCNANLKENRGKRSLIWRHQKIESKRHWIYQSTCKVSRMLIIRPLRSAISQLIRHCKKLPKIKISPVKPGIGELIRLILFSKIDIISLHHSGAMNELVLLISGWIQSNRI